MTNKTLVRVWVRAWIKIYIRHTENTEYYRAMQRQITAGEHTHIDQLNTIE